MLWSWSNLIRQDLNKGLKEVRATALRVSERRVPGVGARVKALGWEYVCWCGNRLTRLSREGSGKSRRRKVKKTVGDRSVQGCVRRLTFILRSKEPCRDLRH